MTPSETFRLGKIAGFVQRLETRRSVLHLQLDEPEFQSIRDVIIGQLKALDLVIQELKEEFGV